MASLERETVNVKNVDMLAVAMVLVLTITLILVMTLIVLNVSWIICAILFVGWVVVFGLACSAWSRRGR